MEGVAVSENSHRMEPGDQEGTTLANDTKIGEFCSSDIQVAINEGNRQGHTFFVIKMGKTGVAMPYQQVIPSDFSKYHPKLHLEDITLEGPCGRSWGVTIRPLNNVSRFGKGWRQFAVENHLREGYQLLFHLVGQSRFVVHFFDNLGKGHASFPPLTSMLAFVEPYSASRRDEQDASEPPLFETTIAKPSPAFETPIAKPPPFETPIAKPPPFETPIAKPPPFETPIAKPPPFENPIAKPPPFETPMAKPPPFETPMAKPSPSETPIAKPPLFETPIANPPPFVTSIAKPPTKPKTPKANKPALNSDDAKIILRQFFTQVHPNLSTDVPNSKAAVPTEDMTEHILNASGVLNDIGGIKTERVGRQGSYEEQTTEEGKAYIFIDSEDDDEPVKQDLPELFIRTPSKRDVFQGMGNKDAGESYLGEQTGFHSPEKVRTTRLARNIIHLMPEERVEFVERDHFEGDQFTRSKIYSDNTPLKYLERQRPVRKKTSLRRASWEGKGGHDPATFAKSDHDHRGTIRDLYKEKTTPRNGDPRGYHKDVRDTSTRGDFVQRPSANEIHSLATLSPAKLLLTQQGCMNYSEIISKRKRGYVTDEERQRPLTVATRFAAGLKNESFLVVMNDYHVYHGFQLSIPRDFLEATGTLKANKVKVCLIDSQKTCYETKWKWHSSCQTPFLNCDGWALFALDHTLEEGDVCVFELVGPGPAFLLSVHIFTVVENLARDNSIRELRGGQSTPFNQKFGRQAPAANNADRELRHDGGKKRPIIDLGRPSLQKTIQKPYNLQAWTKLFKPRVKVHFGGSRGQRQF